MISVVSPKATLSLIAFVEILVAIDVRFLRRMLGSFVLEIWLNFLLAMHAGQLIQKFFFIVNHRLNIIDESYET